MPFHHMRHSSPLPAAGRNHNSDGMSRADKARIQAHFTFQTSQLWLSLDPYAPNRPVPVQARTLEWAGTPSPKEKSLGSVTGGDSSAVSEHYLYIEPMSHWELFYPDWHPHSHPYNRGQHEAYLSLPRHHHPCRFS